MKELLKRRVPVNNKNKKGESALTLAVKNNSYGLLDPLLAVPTLSRELVLEALKMTIDRSDVTFVKKLVEDSRVRREDIQELLVNRDDGIPTSKEKVAMEEHCRKLKKL